MANPRQTPRQQRRPRGILSTVNTNILHLKKPWVVTWWSAAFPGFGHLMLCNYIKGLALMGWEFFVNTQTQLNLVIFYSFTGQFQLAKATLKIEWAIIYIIVYVYTIWDTYRITVELNKFSTLASREKSSIMPMKITNLEINYLDKRHPWIAAAWSSLLPGLGHFYTLRTFTSFAIGLWFVICLFYSNIIKALFLISTGSLGEAANIINIQWLLFLPSIYIFAIYDSYNVVVEYNKVFEFEQAQFLRDNYQVYKFDIQKYK